MRIPLLSPLMRRLRGFRDETEGTVAVEAVIMFPLVMWAFLGVYVYFDGYRQASISHKAASTLADMLSRETEDITPKYITNAKQLFDTLAMQSQDTMIRISVVRWKAGEDAFKVDWSKTKGGMFLAPLENADMDGWESKLPSVPDQERVILVETWATYNPRFRIGMDPVQMHSFVFSRLRFAPQLKFAQQN